MIKEKIIHQVWIGPKAAPEAWMKTWKDKHPRWQFERWGNERVNSYPFINKDKINECLGRGLYNGATDIITYEVLYNFGGFVAPADNICVNSIDELMDIKEDSFTCYENEKRRKKLLSMSLAASKGCKLMKELTKLLRLRTKPITEPWLSTGNKFLTYVVDTLQYPIKIFPSYYFNPVHYTGEKYQGNEKVYAEHVWATTKNLYK